MNWQTIKYTSLVAILLIANTIRVRFYGTGKRADVYFFLDHQRLLANIWLDIGMLTTLSVLSYVAIKVNRAVFLPLFVYSLMQWACYFGWRLKGYSTVINMGIFILMYATMITHEWRKNRQRKKWSQL